MGTGTHPGYVPLAGSEITASGLSRIGPADAGEIIRVTIRLHRKKTIDTLLQHNIRITRDDYEDQYAVSDSTICQVEAFLSSSGIALLEVDKARRSLFTQAAVSTYDRAFKVHLSKYKNENGKCYRGREGFIYIPDALSGDIEGIFGLDELPLATPHLVVSCRNAVTIPRRLNYGFFPHEVAKLYNFPADADGTGQCIGIIALGGGYRLSDIKNYFSYIDMPVPDVSHVSINGVGNSPSMITSADSEVMLDIEVAAAVAPGARIVVYFARNTEQGFLDAVTKAVHDKVNRPSVISISWGGVEKKWSKQTMNNFNEVFKTAGVLGVTICVASGDAGSANGIQDGRVHVDFPASSPYVLACGGTKLVAHEGDIVSEVVWHAADNACSGGGISEFFQRPGYQSDAGVPLCINPPKFKGRGLPDLAGNADYATGYKVLVDGHWAVIGGTSAVAPLYAGLIARLNQVSGNSYGFINPVLYSNPSVCRNIVQGNNITARPKLGYKAGPGWNACAGHGVFSGV